MSPLTPFATRRRVVRPHHRRVESTSGVSHEFCLLRNRKEPQQADGRVVSATCWLRVELPDDLLRRKPRKREREKGVSTFRRALAVALTETHQSTSVTSQPIPPFFKSCTSRFDLGNHKRPRYDETKTNSVAAVAPARVHSLAFVAVASGQCLE